MRAVSCFGLVRIAPSRCVWALSLMALSLSPLLSGSLIAQDNSESSYLRYSRSLIQQYDANHDGKLDKSELDRMRRPPNVDLGDDGKIDEFELTEALSGKKYTGSRKDALAQAKPVAQPAQRPEPNPRASRYQKYAEGLIGAYDTNDDGFLDKDEMSKMRNPPKADPGSDRKLSVEELVASLSGNPSSRANNNQSSSPRTTTPPRSTRSRTTNRGAAPSQTQSPSRPAQRSRTMAEAKRARDKYRAYAQALISQYDKDGDGKLSKEENSKMRRPMKIDPGSDGKIGLEQIIDSLSGTSRPAALPKTSPKLDKPPVRIFTTPDGSFSFSGDPANAKRIQALMEQLAAQAEKPTPDTIGIEYWLLQTNSKMAKDFSFDGLSSREVQRIMDLLASDKASSKVDHVHASVRNGGKFRTAAGQETTYMSSRGRQAINTPNEISILAERMEAAGQFQIVLAVNETVETGKTERDQVNNLIPKFTSFELETEAILETGKAVCFSNEQGGYQWHVVIVATEGNHAPRANRTRATDTQRGRSRRNERTRGSSLGSVKGDTAVKRPPPEREEEIQRFAIERFLQSINFAMAKDDLDENTRAMFDLAAARFEIILKQEEPISEKQKEEIKSALKMLPVLLARSGAFGREERLEFIKDFTAKLRESGK